VPLLRSHKPKHAKPSKTAPTLAVGGMTATLGALATPSADAATSEDFKRLRQCESGNNYRANTGNGYYGAYQFEVRTWRGLGYSGYPHNAAPATQDKAAEELQADRGWQPWPACARKLGLGNGERASRGGQRTVMSSERPAFTETITKKMVHEKRGDVRAWQKRMKARGWEIKVDGQFGRQSASVAARFAAEKGLKAKAGHVNQTVYDAAWTIPVT
jgi:resuscitation-promoting factor RpfA